MPRLYKFWRAVLAISGELQATDGRLTKDLEVWNSGIIGFIGMLVLLNYCITEFMNE